MIRLDGRKPDQLRKAKIIPRYIEYAEGSCLIELGNTKIVCTASVEEKVPAFLKGERSGWITSEYGMLPRSCKNRVERDTAKGRASGRTYEIQRLIGRSLRSVANLNSLGERTLWIDCDAIQSDGGTRCAGITGGFVALSLCLNKLKMEGVIRDIPLNSFLAAVSVGIIDGQCMLDLTYEEDSRADADVNVVMTGSGRLVELQATAERRPFTKSELDKIIALAKKGIAELIELQRKVLKNEGLSIWTL